LAGGLRGRGCTCDVAAAPKTGSMNWAIFVTFDDGLDWVFRSPRSGHHAIVSDETAQKMLLSEVATLKFLKDNTTLPVPEGNHIVGECLSPTLTWQDRDSLEGIERGPFLHESQYLESLISAFIAHAKELSLSPHVFFAPIPDHSEYSSWSSFRAAVRRWNDYVAIGAKIDSSKNRLSYCLAGQMLRQIIPRLSTTNDFYTLSHPDLHPGNIFVDEKFNIVCLIDWGSASSGPISELLATPGLGGSAVSPPKQLVSAFRCGFCPEHPVPAGSWRKADMMWYFSRLVRLLSTQDYSLFVALYKLVNGMEVEDAGIPGLFNKLAAEEENRLLLATLRADDYTAAELEREEDAASGCGKADQGDSRAVARKLTVMAEINRNFVADSKLWRWIERALRERDGDYIGNRGSQTTLSIQSANLRANS
ncbi:hypothetical protein LLEC1_01798, partial [Akanthomyces lecanii]